jgi:hypothetical protein
MVRENLKTTGRAEYKQMESTQPVSSTLNVAENS